MSKRPQKQWPALVLVAMLLVAGFFWLDGVLYPTDENTAAATDLYTKAGVVASETATNTTPNFSAIEWPLANLTKDATADTATTPQTRTYLTTDLHLSADTSSVALRQYASDVKYALREYANPNSPSEVLATMSAYQNGDAKSMATLETLEQKHAATLTSLLAIVVPRDIAPYHLALTNSVSHMSYLVANMLLIKSNPLLGLTSARIFGTEMTHFAKALQTLNGAFAARGLVFGPNDGIKIYLSIDQ